VFGGKLADPNFGAPGTNVVVLPSNRPRAMAPWWHTLIVLVILLGASISQANTLPETVARHGRVPLYASTMIFEWALVAFVWLAMRRRKVPMREVVGGRWQTPEDFLFDVAIAAAFWITSVIVLGAVRYALGMVSLNAAENAKKVKEISQQLDFLIPRSTGEVAAFVALVITAGFCEEVIYRGYLQRQFHAWTGVVAVGVIVQGLLFGASHGYQGIKFMITIAVFGIMFGILAAWRKSLRPGMMAHAWQDLLSGVLLRFLPKLAR
jgi:membrane protease YdiL (CAAX protease family)